MSGTGLLHRNIRELRKWNNYFKILRENNLGITQIINQWSVSCSFVSDSLRPHGLQPTKLLCLVNSPDKNTGASCHFLLQGIFPIKQWSPELWVDYYPSKPPGNQCEHWEKKCFNVSSLKNSIPTHLPFLRKLLEEMVQLNREEIKEWKTHCREWGRDP